MIRSIRTDEPFEPKDLQMNAATLQAFREIAASMQTSPQTWQWVGPFMSQRHFGISEAKAREFAARHGGVAQEMKAAS